MSFFGSYTTFFTKSTNFCSLIRPRTTSSKTGPISTPNCSAPGTLSMCVAPPPMIVCCLMERYNRSILFASKLPSASSNTPANCRSRLLTASSSRLPWPFVLNQFSASLSPPTLPVTVVSVLTSHSILYARFPFFRTSAFTLLSSSQPTVTPVVRSNTFFDSRVVTTVRCA